MSFTKTHKITTVFGIVSIIICCTLLFLQMVDQMLRLDIFPQAWEIIIGIGAWAFGCIGLGTSAISIMLSLFRLAEKN